MAEASRELAASSTTTPAPSYQPHLDAAMAQRNASHRAVRFAQLKHIFDRVVLGDWERAADRALASRFVAVGLPATLAAGWIVPSL